MVKLTEEEIEEIINNPQNLSTRQIAFKYNISHMTAWNIRNKPLKPIEENKLYKTTSEDRAYIKQQKGIKSHIELALQFNISWRQVYNIWNEEATEDELLTFDDYYEEREYKMALKRKLVAERKKKLIEKRELEKKKMKTKKK